MFSDFAPDATAARACLPCSTPFESPARASLIASEQYMPTEYTCMERNGAAG